MALFRGSIFLVELQGKTSVSIFQTTGLPLKWGLGVVKSSDLTRGTQVSLPATSERGTHFKNLQ